MPIDPITGEIRPPNHELAKWRRNHDFQQLPAALTLDDQIREVSAAIAYRLKMERTYRENHRTQLADKQEAKVKELQQVLAELQQAARRSANQPVEVDHDQEVE